MIVRYSLIVLAGAFVLAFASAPLYAQGGDGVETLASAGPAAADETPSPTPQGNGVAAIVNDTVISEFDLRQRIALFVATSGVKPTEKQMAEIREQIMNELETERLQLLEAQKNNVTVNSGEVDKAINNILDDNHLTMDRLTEILGHAGVYMTTLRGQIAAQIAWSKTVQNRYAGDVRISPADIDADMQRLAQGANKPRYSVSEIFLPVDTPEEDGKVQKNTEELDTQIRMGAPFSSVARQFSQNPTAAQGGDLGWVQEGQLQPALNAALLKMNPGEVSDPIRAAGGYYILALRAREVPEGTKLPEQPKEQYPPGELPLARVLLPIGPKPSNELLKNALQVATVIHSNIRDCSTLQQVVAQVHGAIYMNLGVMHLTDLSQQMQQALASTAGGGVTEPFQSQAGIELIMRCDQAPPQITTFKMPTRNQVEEKLFEEQIAVLARRYLRDLRRDADIEIR